MNFISVFFKKIKLLSLILILLSILYPSEITAQVEAPAQIFNRGKLWQSVFNGKIGPSFNNWRRVGVGLDWPGFDPSWINENIGGAPSYLLSGGVMIGAKRPDDSILVVEDWSLAAGTISQEPGAKYIITKHTKPYKNGANYWLQTDPDAGEEVIETVWEYNINYADPSLLYKQLPLRVKRTTHQWSGSRRDENYVIHEYVFTNISLEIRSKLQAVNDTSRLKTVVDTLKNLYIMQNYAMHANSRSWSVLFPTETPSAKNTWFFYDPGRRMIWGRASDYLKTGIKEIDFGFSNSQGLIVDGQPQGEFLAHGYFGVRLLYSSPNNSGAATSVKGFGWSAADPSFDFSGPFANKNTEESQYEVISNPSNAPGFVANPADTSLMRRSRMWSMMSLGPWDLLPGDSIVIAVAEIVDGADYRFAVDPNAITKLGQDGNKTFLATSDKAKFTYDNNLNHPDPPAAPDFTVDFYKERERFIANQIQWRDASESLGDPDDGLNDLTGYNIYRSSFLPIGPWDTVATITKGDPVYYNFSNGTYTFIDSNVQIGTSYYYALTAFDSGRTSWNINPSAVFPETGNSKRVPSLESSIYANKKITPFIATIPASGSVNDVVVVPNPFVIGEGRSTPGEGDRIQFVNLPNPSTIRIYTVRGDLVKTINVESGSGAIASWDQVTDFGQFVESGIYIFHVESSSGSKTGKFAIIR